MNKKGGSFFEKHVEKMVLAVVGLVCLWLLITHVFISPNKVGLGNRHYGPGDVDGRILEQAQNLSARLKGDPTPPPVYDPCLLRYAEYLDSTVTVNRQLAVPLRPWQSPPSQVRRIYDIPLVGKLFDIAVGHIRAVAYVPTVEIDKDNAYQQTTSEPNDIDFVTVEAKLDVAQLYRTFHESFAGEEVRKDWRDPCLARPVLAAVHLQRQELLADGDWGDWKDVPRTRIDPRRDSFDIIEDAAKLPVGGVKVRRLQFDRPTVVMDLLQPEAYRIASADEEWFPPSIHKGYDKFRRELEAQVMREAKEEEKKERERQRYGSRSGPAGYGAGRGTPGYGQYDDTGGWPGAYEEGGRMPIRKKKKPRRPPTTQDVSKPTSADDFYREFKAMLIDRRTDLSKRREPLVFWAHDDTVEPGKTYQYRIRLGVFNPIADTNWFSPEDQAYKARVVLWSGFSEAKKLVDVPERSYFFPTTAQEAAKTVRVQVSKYFLGRWRSKPFLVRQGEVIGKVEENHNKDSASKTSETEENILVPERIDYTTGTMLVDVVRVNDWTGGEGSSLRPRYYFNMLYSSDGATIKNMPVDRLYWPKELRTVSQQIAKAEAKPQKPIRDFQSKLDQYMRRTVGPSIGGEYDEDDEEDMEMEQYQRMLDMMGRRGGR
ncbi:MAG: hypothetical protein ACYTBJ_03605 [Planctomycetota bacterium]|jgi:hypothetical protein